MQALPEGRVCGDVANFLCLLTRERPPLPTPMEALAIPGYLPQLLAGIW